MKKIWIIILFSGFATQVLSQLESKTQTFFSPRYTFQIPGGDMASRFGLMSSLGVSFGTKRQNGLYGAISGNFTFGNDVKEPNILQNLLNSQGQIISTEGRSATILVLQRGFNVHAEVGKFFKRKNGKNETGLLLTGGIGFLEHNIRYEHQLDDVPQLDGEYEKGYDRLSNGLMLSQNIGWLFFSEKRMGDFYLGLEVIEGFTQSRRSYNFDTNESELGINRLDVMIGIKAAWIVPFYKKNLYD